jgi:acyl-CoA synthetase (AMP-forming)/AMP-acid ligase II
MRHLSRASSPSSMTGRAEQHPGIFDVAVFGIPSEQWGEQVHATVVCAPGASLSEADVISYARQRLGGYKCPLGVVRRRAPAHRIGQAAQA